MMMDELELLKKDWQSKEEHLPKLTYDEIYKMLWKKSSSMVKWILIISILEFSLPHLLLLLPSLKDDLESFDKLVIGNSMNWLSAFTYAVTLFFIYQFYRRYKEISVLDDAKNLMKKIIRTRKTVKYYIIYSLSMVLVMVGIVIISIYLNDNIVSSLPELGENAKKIAPKKLKISLMVGIGVLGALITLVIGFVYFLLYGLLLRKLNKNYRELKKMEV